MGEVAEGFSPAHIQASSLTVLDFFFKYDLYSSFGPDQHKQEGIRKA